MTTELYSALAQVFPLLLLALVWESEFLKRLKHEERRLRSDDSTNGVRFWTKPRVRVFSLVSTGWVILDVAITVLVLAQIVPDNWFTRFLLFVGFGLALGALLTRTWVDIIRATSER